MLCAKFGSNWCSGSGDEKYLNVVNVFLIYNILLFSLLGKGHGPSFEQIWTLSLKDALCQVWLKLA